MFRKKIKKIVIFFLNLLKMMGDRPDRSEITGDRPGEF